ncbi:hypothetical protein WICPIJ_008030 [Wickerhamomyces pijperi]|uniref:Uncharacterized protein n=1 Tax=Wickerhamomyces pijperi TaxID=599730 RepID=A0A9P8Q0I9_WICPI|nr:hypothetical protein WICPIJ_008030 [Wickerhamomyces pijperi]
MLERLVSFTKLCSLLVKSIGTWKSETLVKLMAILMNKSMFMNDISSPVAVYVFMYMWFVDVVAILCTLALMTAAVGFGSMGSKAWLWYRSMEKWKPSQFYINPRRSGSFFFFAKLDASSFISVLFLAANSFGFEICGCPFSDLQISKHQKDAKNEALKPSPTRANSKSRPLSHGEISTALKKSSSAFRGVSVESEKVHILAEAEKLTYKLLMEINTSLFVRARLYVQLDPARLCPLPSIARRLSSHY